MDEHLGYIHISAIVRNAVTKQCYVLSLYFILYFVN